MGEEPPMEHPDANVLSAFAEQLLTQAEREPVLMHLARCTDCREVLAAALPAIEVQPVPATTFEKYWRRSALRWTAAAACFLVVGAAVLLRDRAPEIGMRSDADVSVPAAPPAATLQKSPVTADQLAQAKRQTVEEQTNAAAFETHLNATAVPSPPAENKPSVTRSNVAAATKSKPDVADAGSAGTLDAKEARRDESAKDYRSPAAMPLQHSANGKEGLQATMNAMAAPRKAADAVPEAAANEMQTTEVDTSGAASFADSPKSLDFPGRAKTAPQPAPAQAEVASKSAGLKKQAIGSLAKSELAAGGAHWALSDQGQLQRSLDNGSTWEAVPVLESVTFRALSVVGVHVWVGGAKGVLYHSVDAGTHWTQVKPVSSGIQLIDDIVELRFADAVRGQLSTISGEVWITSDAGQSWHKND
jgi:hypothetical protein